MAQNPASMVRASDQGALCGPSRRPGARIVYSRNYAWAASGTAEIALPEMLDPVIGQLQGMRGYIARLALRVTYDITTGVGNALRGNDVPVMIATINLSDRWGPRARDLTGLELALINYLEYPAFRPNTDLSVNGAAQTGTFYLRFPLDDAHGARDGSEWWMSVEDLRGGSCRLTFSAAAVGAGTNAATVNAGTVELVAEIVEVAANDDFPRGRERVRHIWRSYPLTTMGGESYPLARNALIRYAGLYVGDTNAVAAAATTFAAMRVDSRALGLIQVRDDALDDIYRQAVQHLTSDVGVAPGGNVAIGLAGGTNTWRNPVDIGTYQPLWHCWRRSSLQDLPVADSLDARSSAALPANQPRALVSYIEDRPFQDGCGADRVIVIGRNSNVRASEMPTRIQQVYSAKLPAAIEEQRIG